MARPRNFDEDAVIESAMEIFWQLGYDATSIGDLESATGLSRISVYNTFGDKEGLFTRALDNYHKTASPIFQDHIAKGGLRELEQFFKQLAMPVESQSPRNYGCLMVNTILDIRHVSERIQDKVQGYRLMLKTSYVSALKNAVASGDIKLTQKQIDDRAEYLLGCQWGALAMIRFGNRTDSASGMTHVVTQTIRSWKDN